MDFNSTFSKFLYRIEPKPSGGFIATCKDSEVPAIEGATREEVQQKIQASISADLTTQFPALKNALATNDVKLHYHIEAKPGGGFIVHHGDAGSSDPARAPIEGSSRDGLESLIESKIFSAIMKKLPPDVAQQFTDQINAGGVNVDVDKKVSITTATGGLFTPVFSKQPATVSGQDAASVSSNTNDTAAPGEILPPESQSSFSDSTDGSPIVRYDTRKKNGGSALGFLLALAIIAAVMYFWFLRR